MNRFIVVPIICILLLLESTAGAAGAVITCTVTIAEPAPFEVVVTSSTDTVQEGDEFQIVATIENFILTKASGAGSRNGGPTRIKRATARIDFDISGLTLLRPKQVQHLGTITDKNVSNKSVWWELEGVRKGTYVVQVTISGINQAGNPVVTQSSINITVQEPSLAVSYGAPALLFPRLTDLPSLFFGVDMDLALKDNSLLRG